MRLWAIKLYVKATMWARTVAARCKEKDEADRLARIVSVLLGWVLMSYALQAVAALVMTALVKQGSLPGGWWRPLSALLSVVASCLSYPIVIWGVPGLRGLLSSEDSWLRKPRWGEWCRKMGLSRLGAAASTALMGVAGAVACFAAVQCSTMVARLFLGDVSIASSGLAETIKAMAGGEPLPTAAGALTLLTTLLLAPALEETAFRGVVARDAVDSVFASKPDGSPSRARQAAACVLASLAFGLLHVVSLGGWRESVATVVAMTAMGSVLALEARAAKSIWPSIVSHVLYNVVTLALLLALG